ncbi:hypothetical protein FRACA_390011 [Frankia canadensis]|uniref:Uncharacterized protein n=1 Tax=Frankia canadensis TaxID=1836972 RepID=A0A2I2KW45_9ACTN|nr:hypothetical protein FRACA_390011 [Frankia canadensis]SOU57187.1 hypothetical protein FRACA_390011 [Frankia canadensis]
MHRSGPPGRSHGCGRGRRERRIWTCGRRGLPVGYRDHPAAGLGAVGSEIPRALGGAGAYRAARTLRVAMGLSGREGWDNTDRLRDDRPPATPSEGRGRAASGASPARLCTVSWAAAAARRPPATNVMVSGPMPVRHLFFGTSAASWRLSRWARGGRGQGRRPGAGSSVDGPIG